MIYMWRLPSLVRKAGLATAMAFETSTDRCDISHWIRFSVICCCFFFLFIDWPIFLFTVMRVSIFGWKAKKAAKNFTRSSRWNGCRSAFEATNIWGLQTWVKCRLFHYNKHNGFKYKIWDKCQNNLDYWTIWYIDTIKMPSKENKNQSKPSISLNRTSITQHRSMIDGQRPRCHILLQRLALGVAGASHRPKTNQQPKPMDHGSEMCLTGAGASATENRLIYTCISGSFAERRRVI